MMMCGLCVTDSNGRRLMIEERYGPRLRVVDVKKLRDGGWLPPKSAGGFCHHDA